MRGEALRGLGGVGIDEPRQAPRRRRGSGIAARARSRRTRAPPRRLTPRIRPTRAAPPSDAAPRPAVGTVVRRRRGPTSPAVATTSTTRCPCAASWAIVPEVSSASSSGWAWKKTTVCGFVAGAALGTALVWPTVGPAHPRAGSRRPGKRWLGADRARLRLLRAPARRHRDAGQRPDPAPGGRWPANPR